jgi:prevent-host-death family protein
VRHRVDRPEGGRVGPLTAGRDLGPQRLLRRVEAGEHITITVAGRPSARLVPATPRAWRAWEEIAELFHGGADTSWSTDRDRIDGELTDPWAAR